MENEQIEFGNYLASHLQLRELAESIKSGDIDYATDMLKLFENQKLERLREDREAEQRAIERQLELEKQQEYKSE